MKEDDYLILDVRRIVQEQEILFRQFQKEHTFVSYQDLYQLIVMIFYVPPTHILNSYDVAYDRVRGYYYYDQKQLDESISFGLLFENIYLSIMNFLSDVVYDRLTMDRYNPDEDTLTGIRFMTPSTLLAKRTQDRTSYVH